jgi:hypothetical protein
MGIRNWTGKKTHLLTSKQYFAARSFHHAMQAIVVYNL